MQTITPFLWFDTQAAEAAEFYTSAFKSADIHNTAHYTDAGQDVHGQPAGQVMTVEFEIEGQRFVALNGGPHFKFNPSISFFVACNTKNEVDELWRRLSDGGGALMELGEYPFSERYGWLHDKYGLSWQVMFVGEGEVTQRITPALMFVGDVCGKAEEAMTFYTSLFDDSAIGGIARYGETEGPDEPGTIMHASFTLAGQEFMAMDSALDHQFAFNEAISFAVNCDTQEEIDYYWHELSAVPEAEQCGWLKDKFGVSWQIVPTLLGELVSDPDPQKSEQVTQALLSMKKLDIEELQQAYNGRAVREVTI